jgi:GAF domain-containing protein/HAMP domain-containing protein
MLVTLGAAFLGISEYIRAQLWQREAQAAESLNAVASTLLKDAMMAGRRDQIQDALEKLGGSVGGQINDIAVYNDDVVLTSFASGFPGGRIIQKESLGQDLDVPGCSTCHDLPVDERPAMAVVSVEGVEMMRSVVPLYNEPRCQSCHGTGKSVLGDSIVDLRLDRFQQTSTTVTFGLAGGITLAVGAVAYVLYLLLRRIVLSPLEELATVTRAVAGGELERQMEVRGEDELGQVSTAFNSMTTQLRDLIGNLEQRVADRTRDLEQRSAYLEASAEVGQTATSYLEAEALIQQVTDLIKDQFGLYYVGLFVVDERNEWAELRAGTGEAGQKMLAREHRLRVGDGMIGWSIANAQARVALDTGTDAVRFDNPDLPDTRSEAAIPMRSRGRVLGALSVQSTKGAAFDQDTIVVLQTMADQVAVAVDNARLFAAAQEALEAERRAFGAISRTAWAQMDQVRHGLGFICNQAGTVTSSRGAWGAEMLQASQTGEMSRDGRSTVAIPIKIRDSVVGVVRLRKPDGSGQWQDDEVALMESLADQLGTALEGARLYQETQRRAARDRMLGDVAARMRETLDMDTVLQTAIREIGEALDIAEVEVRMGGAPMPHGPLVSEESTSPGGTGREERETAS